MAEIIPLDRRAFLAFPGMMHHLEEELQHRLGLSPSACDRYGDLLVCPAPDVPAALPWWARDVMLEPFRLEFNSIKDAASALRRIQRNWVPYQFSLFRRSTLIQDALPFVSLKPRIFPCSVPDSPIGLYTLLDNRSLIASAVTSSMFPAGLFELQEDHDNPPSRAYLKLQEALTVCTHGNPELLPGRGSRCLDAGACPGGWTWVLTQLGCQVLAIDRAPLDERLMQHPEVTFKKHDAFTLPPSELGDFDWIFSDVICYPERLLDWILGWLSVSKPNGGKPSMICTIKMQGATDWDLIGKFAAIPDSRIVHLNYNKHELTWMRLEPHAGRGYI
jgi:23S rRNA (cytidine2498-2'-O)-methyltransferase